MGEEIVHAVDSIGRAIRQHQDASLVEYTKNQRVDFRRLGCLGFLSAGAVSVFRLSDDSLTMTHHAPAIVGLPYLRNDVKMHYHRFNENSDMWVLPVEKCCSILTEKSLWPSAFDISIGLLREYFDLSMLTSANNITDLVINHLIQIGRMDDVLRMNTSIYTYILSRNQVSRSAVQKIIKKLIDEGVIEVSWGRLVKSKLA
ncbi:transcriptional regulator [Serratia proteamaculans]|uniref:helix-turn-helix domain-containing protein n=1 Tax=Serratia proteamaculans TaxID=28151 RepID=UPI0010766F1B|nr:helix-turn-helix domain-containing protein [Serratia proteamaculans]TFZ48668.1 transcriptional regulator [Serratia proteamaculans]